MKINTKAINKARDFFIQNKKTIAVAESVTAGNIQAALSLSKDASLFFQGGITAYNLGNKCRQLDIEPIHAESCNCVSEVIAEQMAKKVCKLFLAHIGIGITGFASLAPEQNVTELFAFISIADNTGRQTTERIAGKKLSPHQVQLFYTNKAIELLNKFLYHNKK